MAQNTTVTLTAGTWTQLTNANVTAITFQNTSSHHMFVAGTVGASAPSSTSGAIRYNPGQGEKNAALTDLFPGTSGANRVYAYSVNALDVMVSHA
jgi:hypothetical protein